MYWTVHLEGGPRKVNHAATCIGDNIYSFGGYCSCENFEDWMPISVHVLNAYTLRWRDIKYSTLSMADKPFQRYGHTVSAHNNNVYMWGGRNNKVAFNEVCCYDTLQDKWSVKESYGESPDPIDGHSACIINEKMYIFGGFNNFMEAYSEKVYVFDLNTHCWSDISTIGDPPSARDFHSATAVGNRMYVFGGRSSCDEEEEEEYSPEVFYLDTITNVWVSVNTRGDRPKGRRSHSAWLYNDELYIFGGYNSLSDEHFNDLYKLNLNTYEWKCLSVPGEAPCKRRRQACVMHLKKLYLFGGTTPHPDPNEDLLDNSDLHILDFEPSLKALCINAVVKYQLNLIGELIEELPLDIISDIHAMSLPNQITEPVIKKSTEEELIPSLP